jgi:hypothetical protein
VTWVRALLRPPPGPRTVVVVVGGPAAPGAVSPLSERVRLLLERGEVDLVTCDVGALAVPDLRSIDVLARLQLAARRLGSSIRVRHARSELKGLLSLTGLGDVLPMCPGLAVETRWQIEQPEQVRVHEGVHPADPIVRHLDELDPEGLRDASRALRLVEPERRTAVR